VVVFFNFIFFHFYDVTWGWQLSHKRFSMSDNDPRNDFGLMATSFEKTMKKQ
jgi:hypothetical protein